MGIHRLPVDSPHKGPESDTGFDVTLNERLSKQSSVGDAMVVIVTSL